MTSREDQELLSRISDISGRINRFKNSSASGPGTVDTRPQPWNKFTAPSVSSPNPRARVVQNERSFATGSRSSGHRHRSLVVKSNGQTSSTDDENANSQSDSGWVTKRDRHMQLINANILDRTTQARSKAMEQTRLQKALRRDQREKQKIHKFLHNDRSTAHQATAIASVHKVTVDGLNFRVLNGGSKLARIRGAFDSNASTPKQAIVGGVTFIRSKNGNLYRSGVAKAKKARGATRKINEPCKRFTLTGHCGKGPLCPYNHDPSKVAMCRDFLQTGTCQAGDSCDLSHEATPERVPACLHFLRGKCSNASCRYAHVRVNPSAAICRDFATLGYCGKGALCLERHVRECPDYANTGVCRNAKCQLPHVDRAGQIRKQATAALVDEPVSNDDDDMVSDEDDESDSDDMDSDGVEEILGLDSSDDATLHSLSQQQDYVGF